MICEDEVTAMDVSDEHIAVQVSNECVHTLISHFWIPTYLRHTFLQFFIDPAIDVYSLETKDKIARLEGHGYGGQCVRFGTKNKRVHTVQRGMIHSCILY